MRSAHFIFPFPSFFLPPASCAGRQMGLRLGCLREKKKKKGDRERKSLTL